MSPTKNRNIVFVVAFVANNRADDTVHTFKPLPMIKDLPDNGPAVIWRQDPSFGQFSETLASSRQVNDRTCPAAA
jgi:hypothetical protein